MALLGAGTKEVKLVLARASAASTGVKMTGSDAACAGTRSARCLSKPQDLAVLITFRWGHLAASCEPGKVLTEEKEVPAFPSLY